MNISDKSITNLGRNIEAGLSKLGQGIAWVGFWIFLAVSCNTDQIVTTIERLSK